MWKIRLKKEKNKNAPSKNYVEAYQIRKACRV